MKRIDTAAQLLAQIYDTPHDDDCRMVYADALIERGDPRGEFIMLQFKRERQGLSAAERARESQLLATNAKHWMGPIEEVVVPGSAMFRRGFLAACRVHMREHDQRALMMRPEWSTVEHLQADVDVLAGHAVRAMRALHSLGPLAIHRLGALRGQVLPRIDELHVEVDDWEDDHAARIRGPFPALRRLVVLHPDAFSGAADDLHPRRYEEVFAGHCGPIRDFAVRRRVTYSHRAWRGMAGARPDLAEWLARASRSGLDAVTLEPCLGWSFSLMRDSAVDDERARFSLHAQWNSLAATGDLRVLEHAMHALKDHLARVTVVVHGVIRPFYGNIFARLLAGVAGWELQDSQRQVIAASSS